MDRTPQDVYASNLLREQHFGYPLRKPEPKDASDFEGYRIGDVGYVGHYGDFNRVCNLIELHQELQEPLRRFSGKEFPAEMVLKAGVKQTLKEPRYFTSASLDASPVLPDI